jgi:large subunit ribosomal protein L30
MVKGKTAPKKIKVTLLRSAIGFPKNQKQTVLALGLHRLHQTVEHNDNPALRGMLNKVIHLIRIDE